MAFCFRKEWKCALWYLCIGFKLALCVFFHILDWYNRGGPDGCMPPIEKNQGIKMNSTTFVFVINKQGIRWQCSIYNVSFSWFSFHSYLPIFLSLLPVSPSSVWFYAIIFIQLNVLYCILLCCMESMGRPQHICCTQG